MNSGESAESVVRMSLNGVEVAAKITGSTAKAVLLMAVSAIKDVKQVKGKTSLNKMLKSGKELNIFSLKAEDLEKFTQEAKRYGVLYCAVMDKKNEDLDGMVDIMVRAEDAPKINRIVERFKFATIDQAQLKTELEETGINNLIKESKAKGIEIKDIDEAMIDEILNAPLKKEEQQINPNVAKTEKSPLSEPSLESKNNSGVASNPKKPSVRETLKRIKNELKAKELSKDEKVEVREGQDINKSVDLDKNKSTNIDKNIKPRVKKGKER